MEADVDALVHAGPRALPEEAHDAVLAVDELVFGKRRHVESR
jgi:hypothetical protein